MVAVPGIIEAHFCLFSPMLPWAWLILEESQVRWEWFLVTALQLPPSQSREEVRWKGRARSMDEREGGKRPTEVLHQL